MAVDRKGKVRNILQSPGYLWLQDISASGKVLLGDSQEGGGISFHAADSHGPAETVDRPVDVASESNEVDGISADGTELSVTYSGANSGVDYTVYFAKNDGSTPVRIGDGAGIGITPDGKHILVGMASANSHLRLYPTGTGDARDIDISPVHVLDSRGSWTSDGSRRGIHGRRTRQAATHLRARSGGGQGAAGDRGRRDQSLYLARRPLADRAKRTARVRALSIGRRRAAAGERASKPAKCRCNSARAASCIPGTAHFQRTSWWWI